MDACARLNLLRLVSPALPNCSVSLLRCGIDATHGPQVVAHFSTRITRPLSWLQVIRPVVFSHSFGSNRGAFDPTVAFARRPAGARTARPRSNGRKLRLMTAPFWGHSHVSSLWFLPDDTLPDAWVISKPFDRPISRSPPPGPAADHGPRRSGSQRFSLDRNSF